MERGIAKQAAEKYPWLPSRYGQVLKWTEGNQNNYNLMVEAKSKIICLPVKKKWSEKADITIIADSLRQLVPIMGGGDRIYLPLLGCGYGELEPKDVMPLLEALDDRFTLVLRSDEVVKKYPASFKESAFRRDKLH